MIMQRMADQWLKTLIKADLHRKLKLSQLNNTAGSKDPADIKRSEKWNQKRIS